MRPFRHLFKTRAKIKRNCGGIVFGHFQKYILGAVVSRLAQEIFQQAPAMAGIPGLGVHGKRQQLGFGPRDSAKGKTVAMADQKDTRRCKQSGEFIRLPRARCGEAQRMQLGQCCR